MRVIKGWAGQALSFGEWSSPANLGSGAPSSSFPVPVLGHYEKRTQARRFISTIF